MYWHDRVFGKAAARSNNGSRAIAGRIFGAARETSMIGIKHLCLTSPHPPRRSNLIVMRHSQAVAFCLLLSSVIMDNYVYANASVKPCAPPSPVLVSTEGGPDLVPPATEFQPRGWASLDLTISKNGKVIAVAVGEWQSRTRPRMVPCANLVLGKAAGIQTS